MVCSTISKPEAGNPRIRHPGESRDPIWFAQQSANPRPGTHASVIPAKAGTQFGLLNNQQTRGREPTHPSSRRKPGPNLVCSTISKPEAGNPRIRHPGESRDPIWFAQQSANPRPGTHASVIPAKAGTQFKQYKYQQVEKTSGIHSPAKSNDPCSFRSAAPAGTVFFSSPPNPPAFNSHASKSQPFSENPNRQANSKRDPPPPAHFPETSWSLR